MISEYVRTTEDFDTVSGIVDSLYDACIDQDLWPTALEKVSKFLGARACVVVMEDRANAQIDICHSTVHDSAWLQQYVDQHRSLDRLKTRALEGLDIGAVRALSDFLTGARLRETSFYHRWMAPHEYVDAIGCLIDRKETETCFLVAWRDKFADVDLVAARSRLALLRPHLRRSLYIHRRVNGHRAVNAWLASIFDGLAAPIFVVDKHMRVLHSNCAARRMLESFDSFGGDGGVLKIDDVEAQRSLECAIRDRPAHVVSGHAKTVIVSIRRHGDYCCVAHVLPIEISEESGEGAAAIVVRKISLEAKAPPTVGQIYGLTEREQTVFFEIVRTGGIPAAAKALDLAESTVKGYLKNIFAKTGVNRQADLVKLACVLEAPFLT